MGIDTGGTFTDLVACIGTKVRRLKLLSTPADPATAVLAGLRELLAGTQIDVLTYGSTVATNALLQRTGARVVLVTTAGFEDVIEIARQTRPSLYDLEPVPPQPLVPRSRRIGVAERVLHDGSVLVPLREPELRRLQRQVAQHRAEAVAVCFLHSYANPKHEKAAGAALTHSAAFCSLSHALVAQHREYERLSTAVINAYVGPAMDGHLRRLESGLGRTRLRVMQSNGGAISASLARREAVRTVLSGPAAGVVGAWSVARALGLNRIITFDMGGTSTDVSLLDGGFSLRTEWTVAGLPLQVPAIDIHTVGAGGGSIAQVDAGGALKVGPQSAGADPGPACYGRGQLPTVTDANLTLGRLLPTAFLGGRMRLHEQRSRSVFDRLGKSLGADAVQAAEGVVRVVNASMERAVRSISVERGHEPADYALFAFGGAAGQHACALAVALGIRRVIIPTDPGLLSARGAASADIQRDYVRTVRLTNPGVARLRALLVPLERHARSQLHAEGIAPADRRLLASLDVRYEGQSYEITLPFTPRFTAAFHAAHRRLYGYADRSRPLEVVSVRLLALGRGPQVRKTRMVAGDPSPAAAAMTHARLRWEGSWLRVRVHDRAQLHAGSSFSGPAIITEPTATTLLPPRWRCRVQRSGHLELLHED